MHLLQHEPLRVLYDAIHHIIPLQINHCAIPLFDHQNDFLLAQPSAVLVRFLVLALTHFCQAQASY